MQPASFQINQPIHSLFYADSLFLLTGLPPSIEQQDRFSKLVENGLDQAVFEFSDELLSNPHFGERWARHWMDWLRYADSHGSEGDPQFPMPIATEII